MEELRSSTRGSGESLPAQQETRHIDTAHMTSPREQGDGAPVLSSNTSDESQRDQVVETKPFTIRTELDVVQILLTVFALATRTWRLGVPRAVVFDELHFAKFVSLYLKRIFFFDVHPPLGKMILAMAGSYAGFEGDVNFERIGAGFPPSVPVEMLRAVPAITGSLVVPICYQICVEAGLSRYAAAMAGIMVAIDNALLVQSRFMLMEGMLIFFSTLSVLAYLKFRNCHREFSLIWWFWLCLAGISFTCTLSVKYVGVFTMFLVVVRIWRDFWRMLDDSSRSDMTLVKHLFARLLTLVTVPVAVYLSIFYVHLSVLHKAGPHDNIMTSAFQASLEGGLAALTRGQPLYVSYGSQITLRHTENLANGQPCWLHSHAHMYPVKYPDKRGSSHQQQVTCYVFKDINNWWIIKKPESHDLMVDDPPVPVKHGDIVQLIHGVTSRALNSHDVAAPMTPSNQEVSCYVNYNVSMPAQNLWRVDIVNRDSEDEQWQTIKSQIRLVHVNTTTAIKTTGKQLPEWGFNQLEVSADRLVKQKATVWNVEEHRYTRSSEKEQQAADLQQAEMIPMKATYMSFWAKLYELQFKMLFSTQDARLEHKYSSLPQQWPFMAKNIAYWMSPKDNSQIHLIGNVVIWYSSMAGVLGFFALLVFYLLRRQRAVFDISEDQWQHFLFLMELFVGGYLIHYLPYFLEDRTLFLHHYLPSVVYKIMALAAFGDHLYTVASKSSVARPALKYSCVVLLAVSLQSFLSLSVFTFGSEALSKQRIEALTWVDSWDFLSHDK
ncbi:protein O-mannosyl-transferase 1 [Aplysia californica]|uniref:dolichyl-phosphate-mannose--protein mannosyltransferase n=1 Tax=Aplysia californica TaxID=6500 RepID=A0ABM0JFN1_APLCA|nr:protein O-mannosyl-transferase 1 [Aplysia californica]